MNRVNVSTNRHLTIGKTMPFDIYKLKTVNQNSLKFIHNFIRTQYQNTFNCPDLLLCSIELNKRRLYIGKLFTVRKKLNI